MRQLTDKDIATLVSSGRATNEEKLVLEGDVVVAVDVKTGQRRIVDTSGLLIEGSRRLLCD